MNVFYKASELFRKSIDNAIIEDDLNTVIEWPREQMSVLFACTDQIRQHFFGSNVEPCSLMNVKSGGCSEDCTFCSQSEFNESSIVVRDLASPTDIIRHFDYARSQNLPLCIVASGIRISPNELQLIADTLKECHGEKHASLGMLGTDELALLKNAGVTCYNHNLETNRSYFPRVITTHSWEERLQTVKNAQSVGLKVCCGGIFGIGETWEDRKEFIMQLKELDITTIPINFLNAKERTNIKKSEDSHLDYLKIISLFRIAMPDKMIKICCGREENLGPLQSLMFFAGANGYVTGDYLHSSGAGLKHDDKMIAALGLEKKIRKMN